MPVKFPMTMQNYWTRVIMAPVWYPMMALGMLMVLVLFPFVWLSVEIQEWFEKKYSNFFKKKYKQKVIEGLEDEGNIQ
jgi:TM2 domain-containing membrane protein YozV